MNCFLTSLAEQRGNQAIAVILSGTASDGTLGVKAIKAEGGLVFAQDEQSAGHFGMPQSAAATGVVDFILSPEKIAAELVHISRHPVMGADMTAFDRPAEMTQIFQIVRRATSVDFSLYKASTIKRRIMRRLMVHKFKTLAPYVALLKKNPEEVRALHDDLLIHVTHFFREPAALEALRAKAFPRILKDLAADAPIRVWVPGCSTGEEAYSLVIELMDFLSERDCDNPIQVFATDISDAALDRARAGVYSEEIVHHVPPRYLRRFFTKVERGYAVAKRVRDACVFAKQDLTRDPPFANVDLISCCNVLIYLAPQAQKQILPMFHYALRPAGALVLSRAEGVGEFDDLFSEADEKNRIYFRKPSTARGLFPAGARTSLRSRESAPPAPPADQPSGWPESDVQKVAERILLSRFAPAGVIINGELNIVHFRGHVNRYLEPAAGKPSTALLRMMPAHTAGKVEALVKQAKKADAPAKESGLELGDFERAAVKIDVEVIPFRLPLSGDRYFIILFEENPAAPALAKSPIVAPSKRDAARQESAALKRLKGELSATRSYLQNTVEEHEAANEELKSANEEIISSNEELQSTNEELEIAKEELQAANEELSTVNEELQSRNRDLGGLNDDLRNLISSVHLAILMVSTDLRIRRFSPMAEKVMSLIPGDVGRPIGDIKMKIELPNIEEIIHDVMDSALTKELDVLDSQGRSYSVRVRPYKTAENKIEGVVIVFVDNDPVARGVTSLKNEAFAALMEISETPVVVLDRHLRVLTGSRSTYQDFGLTQGAAAGKPLFEIENGRWNVPAVREALERVVKTGQPFTRLAVTVAEKELRASARLIGGGGGGGGGEPEHILMSLGFVV